jgi:hypothetical protein
MSKIELLMFLIQQKHTFSEYDFKLISSIFAFVC